MKELLEKISEHAMAFDKDENPAEYNEVLKLIKKGFVNRLNSTEEKEVIFVRITLEGRKALLKL
ncbi:hypothetical protein [Chryseobacterium sp. JV274]|uniref:hypothetical protein n=1 Tax=Chryseobacterium sp. JV274 TaxID=1932669 RepID=UPI0015C26CA0|nr:hypothetical protein [Chryseobacterium sp. JV274]CAD0220420.1 protein of unknown function [Chryseobacterium sp. JV274]